MSDKRHDRRIKRMQQLFACTFSLDTLKRCREEHSHDFLSPLLVSLEEIDALITKAAPERPLDQIGKLDLAILRLIVFESNHANTPKKVLIDEGVELAKAFGSDSSPKFVNGVLATILLEQKKD